MISANEASMIAWSGVYFFVAAYFLTLYVNRRRFLESGLFAAVCVCVGVLSFASGIGLAVADNTVVEHAQRVQLAAFFASGPVFAHFVWRVTEAPHPRLRRAAYAGAATAAVCAVFGLLSGRRFGDINLLGAALMSVSCLVTLYALGCLVAASRHRVDLRIASATVFLGCLTVLADIVLAASGHRPPTLLPHVGVLGMMAFAYVLVGRFTATQEQLEQRTAELQRSYDHMRQTQAELVKTEQLAAVGEMSAVIAHDVRNPLAIMKSAVSELRDSCVSATDEEVLLEIVDEETERLNRLVNGLLAYARPVTEGTGAVDVGSLVTRAVRVAAEGNRNVSDIAIELDVESDVGEVEGDPSLLNHALINIVDNAMQAMPHGGTLTVTCRAAADEGAPSVCLDVHDTGEGMDTLVRSRAREAFFTTRESGTGLGLAIVDRVARVHGGRVELESRHGHGSTVRLVLPRHRPPEPTSEEHALTG